MVLGEVDEPELQPRPEPNRPVQLAHCAKNPPCEAPRDKCDGDLENETDEERGRGEEHRDAAVHDPLDVLLDDERRQGNHGEDARGRR